MLSFDVHPTRGLVVREAASTLTTEDWQVVAGAGTQSDYLARIALHSARQGRPLDSLPSTRAAVAVYQRRTGRLHLTCGVSAGSGMVFAEQPDGAWSFATNTRELLQRLSTRPALDPVQLGAWAALCAEGRPPIAGVGLVGLGQRLDLARGETPAIRTWFSTDGSPVRGQPEELAEQYADLLADVMRRTLPPSGDVSALMSAGLDSTMVVASAAEVLAPDRQVAAWCLDPLPPRRPEPSTWLYSDLPDALSMQRRWPNVQVLGLRNDEGLTAIDVLPHWFDASGLPATNPSNMVWMAQAQMHGSHLGHEQLLTGFSGNRTFSWQPPDAWLQLAGRGRVGALVDAMRAHSRATGLSMRAELRRLIAPAVWRLRRPAMTNRVRPLLAPGILDSLDRDRSPYFASGWTRWRPDVLQQEFALNGDDRTPVTTTDPLGAEPLIRFVSRLPTQAFVGVGDGRSLARRAMNGRVPDRIRLRVVRGIQAADADQWIEGNDRWLATALAVTEDPDVADVVDVTALREIVRRSHTDGTAWTLEADRALGLGLYVIWLRDATFR